MQGGGGKPSVAGPRKFALMKRILEMLGFEKSMDAVPVTIRFLGAEHETQPTGLQTFRDQKLSFLRLIVDSPGHARRNRLEKKKTN